MINLALEMEQAGTILRNVNQPRIKALLATYGYDAPRLQEGQSLLNQLQLLQQAQKDGYQLKGQVGRSLRANEQEMHRRFIDHRTLAKWVFRHDADEYQRLELHQSVSKRQAAKTTQIRSFYYEALKAPQMLVRHGLTKAELNQAQAMVEAIVEARRERLQKSGEAQHATQQRDKVRNHLRTWVNDFRTIARVALRSEPQLLEVLGMTVVA